MPEPEAIFDGKLVQLLKLLWQYRGDLFAITEPLDDVEGLRKRLLLTLTALAQAAELSETAADDRIVEAVTKILGSQTLQDFLLPILAELLGRLQTQDATALAIEPLSVKAERAFNVQGIGHELVLAIIRMIVELISMFRVEL